MLVNVKTVKHPIVFREMVLAHELLDGKHGIELGAAAHNPFGIKDTLNVAPMEDRSFYQNAQVEMCGSYTAVDVTGEADNLPFGDASQQFVLASHCFEHFPNPIQALWEFARVLEDDGIVFLIIPKRDALPEDAKRPVTPIPVLEQVFLDKLDIDTTPTDNVPGGRRGHYYVYTLETVEALFKVARDTYRIPLEVMLTEETDSKVGNGFTVVARRIPRPPQLQSLNIEPMEGNNVPAKKQKRKKQDPYQGE